MEIREHIGIITEHMDKLSQIDLDKEMEGMTLEKLHNEIKFFKQMREYTRKTLKNFNETVRQLEEIEMECIKKENPGYVEELIYYSCQHEH